MSTIRTHWPLLLTIAFTVAVMLGVYHDFPWLALLPVAAAGIWMAFTRLDILLLFLVAAVPLSLNLEDMEIGGGGLLPTEPLLAGLLLLFILRAMRGFPVDQRLLRHPLIYWIAGSLVWILLTAIVSEYPVVSFKFLTARLWFIIGFFFFLGHLFLHALNAGISSSWPMPFRWHRHHLHVDSARRVWL